MAGINKTVARYLVLNLGLFFMLLLILFSITGAFLGAERAALFFNSPPLAVFWVAMTVVFAAGFVFWKSLRRRPFLLLCHAGCIAVLLGGMWGSRAAHQLRDAVGAEPKAIKGMMMLRPGQSERRVFLDDQTSVFELPFTVHMHDTAVSYYDEPSLGIYTLDGRFIGRVPTKAGYTYPLDDAAETKVHVVRRFENLRLETDERGIRGIEGPPGRRNPGYEVIFIQPDSRTFRHYVFEMFDPHMPTDAPYLVRFLPPRIAREYTSDLSIERDGQTVAQKTIRVNHPLYYDGYHFYQTTFGQDEHGFYSGIQVVSDSGVWMVFFGYALLTIGLCGQYWVVPLMRRRRRREGK